MRKDKITEDQKLTRLKELAGIKLNENKHTDTSFSTINYTRKIGDTTYGVVKEHGSYYIKSTTSELITESTMDYIGGLENKNHYKYNSYADALKNLNMINFTINESEDFHDKTVLNERLEKDFQPAPAPGEGEQQAPAPQIQAPPLEQQPQPEAPAPEQAPSPEMGNPEGELPQESPEAPEEEGEFGDDSLDGGNGEDIEHYLGKTTAAIRKVPVEDFSEERIKSIMNTIISALPLDKLSPEELLKLARRVKRGGRKEDDDNSEDSSSEQPAPENDEVPHDEAPAPEPSEFPEDEPIQEGKKLPWDKCEKNAEKEYGSKKTADKVCGAIKAGKIKEDVKECEDELEEGFIKPVKGKIIMKEKKGEPAIPSRKLPVKEPIVGKYSEKDDDKINEFIGKMDKKDMLKEGSKIKYKNVILESDGKNKLTMNNGKTKFEFLVKNATIQKLNELAEPVKKTLNEADDRSWIARFYDKNDKVFHTETYTDRSEHEAGREAESYAENTRECEDWSLSPLKNKKTKNLNEAEKKVQELVRKIVLKNQ